MPLLDLLHTWPKTKVKNLISANANNDQKEYIFDSFIFRIWKQFDTLKGSSWRIVLNVISLKLLSQSNSLQVFYVLCCHIWIVSSGVHSNNLQDRTLFGRMILSNPITTIVIDIQVWYRSYMRHNNDIFVQANWSKQAGRRTATGRYRETLSSKIHWVFGNIIKYIKEIIIMHKY